MGTADDIFILYYFMDPGLWDIVVHSILWIIQDVYQYLSKEPHLKQLREVLILRIMRDLAGDRDLVGFGF